MRYQFLALLGSIAHGVRTFVAAILSLVGLARLARFAVPLLAALLALGAVLSGRDTAEILSARPEVTESTLVEVAAHSDDSGGSVWYAFDAVIAAQSLPTPADLGTFFYLARDPDDPSQGLLVRSPLNDLFFRQRLLSADLVEDADLVAFALDAFGSLPTGFSVDRSRFLDEVSAGGEAETASIPSRLTDEPAGERVAVAGRVVAPARYAACATSDGCEAGGDAEWLYLLADPQGADAIVLRSPHPPDAVPTRLEGLYLRDAFDLAPVLESDWFRAIDADVPTARAFQAGSRPPITVEASWLPTIIYAALAVLLAASHLVGYPVFGASRSPGPQRSLASGESLDVAITGRLQRDRSMIELDRSPGALERLTIPDLALRMWRYGLLSPDLSRQEAERRYVEEAGAAHDRLVVHERDQSALLLVDPGAGASVRAGRLYRLGRSTPAVHLRHGSNDAYLELPRDDERDRAAAELAAEIEGRPPS